MMTQPLTPRPIAPRPHRNAQRRTGPHREPQREPHGTGPLEKRKQHRSLDPPHPTLSKERRLSMASIQLGRGTRPIPSRTRLPSKRKTNPQVFSSLGKQTTKPPAHPRAPSRHCTGARGNGHTRLRPWHGMSTPPHPRACTRARFPPPRPGCSPSSTSVTTSGTKKKKLTRSQQRPVQTIRIYIRQSVKRERHQKTKGTRKASLGDRVSSCVCWRARSPYTVLGRLLGGKSWSGKQAGDGDFAAGFPRVLVGVSTIRSIPGRGGGASGKASVVGKSGVAMGVHP